jgi:predicted outer membrane repeat protein
MKRGGIVGILVGISVAAGVLGDASPGIAATEIAVDCGAGADLQAAINAAPKGAILDISGTCRGTFTIHRKITLKGVSNAVLDGQALGTTVAITRGTVKLSHLTITGGDDQVDCIAGGIRNAGALTLIHATVANNRSCDGGGGIYATGRLVLRHSLITQNNGEGFQGGILSDGGPVTIQKSTVSNNDGTGVTVWAGTLTITDSTVSGNGATYDGGIFANDGVTSTILRSTIANNDAFNGETGGVGNTGTMTITASTIVGNDGDGDPGGVWNLGTLTITATIIAGNTSGSPNSDCEGTITSNGYNLIGILEPADLPACGFTPRSTDQVGTTAPIDPLLLALGNYGGPTQTVKPKATSPAVNKLPVGSMSADGTLALCPSSGSTDQRGRPRPNGPACDIGSVER